MLNIRGVKVKIIILNNSEELMKTLQKFYHFEKSPQEIKHDALN